MRTLCAIPLLIALHLAAPSAGQDRISLPPPVAKPKTDPQTPPANPPTPTPTPTSSTPPAAAPSPAPLGTDPRSPKPVTTPFDAKPVTVEDPGLTLLIPKGAAYTSERAAGIAELQISPPDKSWIFRIFTRAFGDRTMATGEVMKAQIEAVKKSDEEARTTSTLLEHQKLVMIAGRPGERVYFEMPSRDGRLVSMRGITIVKTQPGVFLFAEVVCDKAKFEASRTAYEDTLTTLSVADPAASAEKVAALVKAGDVLLKSVSDEDLKAIVTARPDRWERFYQPGQKAGDEHAYEIGYRWIRTGFGKRSQFSEFSDGSGDNAEGFFVRIDSRVRVEEDLVDMMGIFFLSEDRKEELWTLTVAYRSKGVAKPVVTREVGARKDDNLTVTTTDGSGMGKGKPVHTTVPPEGYVSRVEHYLLPQILVRKQSLADFGFYSYNHEDQRIKLRTDKLSTDKAGKVYEIQSSLRSLGGEKTLVQTAEIRATGELISLRLADGSMWEPTTVDRLRELWKAKGLPLN